jgi:hypothetical protein
MRQEKKPIEGEVDTILCWDEVIAMSNQELVDFYEKTQRRALNVQGK